MLLKRIYQFYPKKSDWKLFTTKTKTQLSSPVVTTSNGKVQGSINKLYDGSEYFCFKGIPYAQPAVGRLRFKAPLPPTPWPGVYDATKNCSMCVHVDIATLKSIKGNEDCLFLNVYSKSLETNSKLPVMVYIHGGAYMSGTGNFEILGPDYLLQHNVVLVTMNYRLELLGFLSLDTPEVPGNGGMKDQVAALRWVQENIARFGGDPKNVTLFGESAGAASVTLHMMSPMSKELFHKAISMSGVGTCDWAFSKYGRERAIRVAKGLGKTSEDPDEILDYFQSLPAQKFGGLTGLSMTYDESHRGIPIYFNPIIEKKFEKVEPFLISEPLEILKSDKIRKMPLIIGYNCSEGIFFLSRILNFLDFLNENLGFSLPREIAEKVTKEKLDELGLRIRKHYVGDRSYGENDIQALCDKETDFYFSYNIHRFAHIYSQNNKEIYMYKFGLDTDLNYVKKSIGRGSLKGASHADDVFYMFASSVVKDVYENQEKLRGIVYNFTKMWTDFAKTGNPTPDKALGYKWSPYTAENKEYLNIGQNTSMDKYADRKRVEFWDQLYKEAGLPCLDNVDDKTII